MKSTTTKALREFAKLEAKLLTIIENDAAVWKRSHTGYSGRIMIDGVEHYQWTTAKSGQPVEMTKAEVVTRHIEQFRAIAMRDSAREIALKQLKEAGNSVRGHVRYCVEQVIDGGEFVRPCYTQGSGRYSKQMDYTQEVCHALDLLKIKYSLTNDAPRGGLLGNLISTIKE